MKLTCLLCLVLAVALSFMGCASSGISSTGTSTHIGGYIDTGVQKKF